MPHDLEEMEGQLRELGKWMMLTAMTTAAAGDCDRGTMASNRTTTIVALMIDRFDDDGGGETKPAVIIDGETYRIVELRRGAVVPRWQSSSSSSSYHPLERAYWLWSKLRGTIYRRVRRGTVLRRHDQPVRVSVDVEGSAVVEAGWMSTSVHVAIKEMSWELVGEHWSMLAENPIKEVAAMQYLQAFFGDERRRRRCRRGEEGRRGLPRSWTWRGGHVQSRLPTQRRPRRPAPSPWLRPPESDGYGDA